MRDGRRKRLGLEEGTEGTVGDTYLDRILTDEEAAANPYTIAADTDVNFDTRDFRNISDTYNYYYGGGFDTAQDDATPPSSGDGGSGDGGTGGGTTPTTGDTTPGTNTPEQQRLIDEGTGLQIEPGSPVFAPGEMPVTQEEIDAFNQIPVNQNYATPDLELENQYEDPDRFTLGSGKPPDLELENQYEDPDRFSETYFDGTATLEDAGGTYDGMQSAEGGFGINPTTGRPYGTPGQDSPDMDDGIGLTKVELDQIQDSSLKGQLSDIFTNAKNLGKSAAEVTQELIDKGVGTYNNLNKTVNVPLLGEIDVGQTLGGIALNAAFNAPVSLLMYAMKQMPESKSQIEYAGYTDAQKAAVDEAYGPGGVMEGYNEVSAFGKGVEETIQGRIDNYQKNYTAEELAAMSPTGIYNRLLNSQMKIKTGGTGIDFNDTDNTVDDTVYDNDISVEGLDDETGRFTDTTVDNISPGYSPDDDDPGDDGDDRDDGPSDTTDASGTEGEEQDRFGGDTYGGGQDAGQSDFSGGNVTDSKSGDTYGGEAYGYNEAAEKGNDSGGNGNNGGGGCVIATHAVNSGAFTKDTKREAVRWCVKNLHRKWWGEAVRKGYRYYGQKAIEQGKAKNHYQEFKDYVAFGTGKRRTLKTGWTFVYRTVQFFLKGLTL